MFRHHRHCRRNLILSLWTTTFTVIVAIVCGGFSKSVIAFAAMTTKECAVVGVGVLGTSLCKQLLESPACQDWKITGITKTTNRHDEILEQVGGDHNGRFSLTTMDEMLSSKAGESGSDLDGNEVTTKKYQHCVFCAPPSGFDDYPGAVKTAATDIWAGPEGDGVFVFTSSGGIYGPGESTLSTVTEDSPVPDPSGNPRSERLQAAESVVRDIGGASLRLAGLYTLERGAHNFWLASGKDEVGGRADGLVNLLHYDDAAGSVVAALTLADPDSICGKTFLVSDGNPLTRQQICESSLKSQKYQGMKIPVFTGTQNEPIGMYCIRGASCLQLAEFVTKVISLHHTPPNHSFIIRLCFSFFQSGKLYDGSQTNTILKWKPRYPSFDSFMASNRL
jgi:nucleoside-diphosphate-sugar epimerase